MAHTNAASPSTYLSDLTRQLEREWPANRTIDIVCHGHSVPAGYFKTPVVDTFNAYPHLLHQGIKARFPHAVVNVIVTAIGGEGSPSGAARFEHDVMAHRPDLVLIDYALNDRGLPVDEARAAWTSMIVKALGKGIKVILLTPTGDTNATLDDDNDPINQHARQVRDLAAQHGVGLVDSLSEFKRYIRNGGRLDELMSQTNHPSRRGHDLVAVALMEWFPVSVPRQERGIEQDAPAESER